MTIRNIQGLKDTACLENVCAALPAVAAAVLYLITLDPSVSYWDCPEYVATASLLEVGHPPGNPIWTLVMRVLTIPFPRSAHAVVINASSALFMALAVFFAAKCTFRFALWAGLKPSWAGVAAFTASSCFALLDSTWFSAVEAEVYALSTFLSALTVWLALKTASAKLCGERIRLSVLTAWALGISVGVHQLNLLCIPAVALIWCFARYPEPGRLLRITGGVGLSLLAVALILFGLMPGSLAFASILELTAVNDFGLPLFSGTVAYPFLALLSFAAAYVALPRTSRPLATVALTAALWMSGVFLFDGRIDLSLAIAVVAARILTSPKVASRLTLQTGVMMLAMFFTGYCAVALVLIRGYAAPPINESAPTDIFALRSYCSREQYGSKPLVYGPTPFSRPMLQERFLSEDSIPDYSRYALKKGGARYVPCASGIRLVDRSGFMSAEDSAGNIKTLAKGQGYILSDYRFSRVMTPELNMFFPRITESGPEWMECYEGWAGMTPANMDSVGISTVFRPDGTPAGRISLSGERECATALRPTYMQQARFFLSYQLGYMYFRYLLWNFLGRQNDIPSTGGPELGNFITGLPAFDNAMLGDQDKLPLKETYGNPGRHVYFFLPLLLGLAGILLLLYKGRRSRRVLAVTAMLFLMTGPAITVYLNQSPGEPRERDYAFIVSYMVFAVWAGFGTVAAGKGIGNRFGERAGTAVSLLLGCATAALLLTQNLPDHDRRGRSQTRDFAQALVAGKEGDIIFTFGDNFTFPLWYLQEVEDAAPEAAIIDVSYLALPEYVLNLMKQGAKGIILTAKPSDIAGGAYAFTKIPADADTTPIPAISALRELYSQKEGYPAFRHSRIIMPGENGDSITVNLRNLTGGSLLPFKQLMILDILATNNTLPHPRPVSFLSHLRPEISKAVAGATFQEAFSDTYAPGMTDSTRCSRAVTAERAIRKALKEHDSGKSHYIDPVIAGQAKRLRIALKRPGEQPDSTSQK